MINNIVKLADDIATTREQLLILGFDSEEAEILLLMPERLMYERILTRELVSRGFERDSANKISRRALEQLDESEVLYVEL